MQVARLVHSIPFPSSFPLPRSHAPTVIVEANDFRVCNRILDMLRDGKAPNAQDLATEFNLSKPYLQRLFKQETGLSLARLLTAQRLEIAAQLLRDTNMRIKEIASRVRYEHTSSFIRAFKHRFTKRPHMYRQHSSNLKKVTKSSFR